MRIRAHSLLCIQGFVGEGYSPEFIENMWRVVESLDPDVEVTVLAEPDVLCSACPNLADTGCTLSGPGAEADMERQDRDVLRRLGIRAGETLRWGEILERIRRTVDPAHLDSICGACPWLSLGHCKQGLDRLKSRRS